jgi:hypothetical protein
MTYPIWIGADKAGRMCIGAKFVRGYVLDDKEQVFGSQLPHRVVAKTSNGYKLVTPTEAYKNNYVVSDWGEVPMYRRWTQREVA